MSSNLKPYPAMKDSGVKWLGEVPEHWEVRKLRCVLREVAVRNRPDLPLLSVVREKGVILRDLSNKDENHNFIPDDLSNYKVVRVGQFALNKMKAWQGSYGISQYDGIVSPAYFIFNLEGVERDYFNTAIRSKAYITFFKQASDGVRIGQWDLSKARMREIPLFVPPLSEQAAIVRYLDYIDRRVKRYVRAKQKLIKLLEEEKQAVIHRAVTRGLDPNVRLKPSGVEWLGEVPVSWKMKRFKFVVRIRNGQVDPRTEAYCKFPLIAPEHLEKGTGRILKIETAEEQGAISGKYIVKQGEIIYSKIRPALRKASIAPCDCLCSADMYPLMPDHSEILSDYLLAVLLSNDLTRYLVDCSMRVAMPKVNREALGNAWLCYPDKDTQKHIISELKEMIIHLDEAKSKAQNEINLIREYRTRLIADVVTGKLDVRGIEVPEVSGEELLDIEKEVEEPGEMTEDAMEAEA